MSFLNYLQKAYSLTGAAASSLAYALALCSSPSGAHARSPSPSTQLTSPERTDLALPALQRIRSIIHAVGRYGPSPFLVGHYGGAGDLVGGFSRCVGISPRAGKKLTVEDLPRICAVWGGGQILGRPLLPLDLSPPPGIPVPASQPPFRTVDNPPPPPALAASTSALGIPVVLSDEPRAAPTVFTGDWVVCSPYLFTTLFPSRRVPASLARDAPRSVRMIAVLSRPIPFPRPSVEEADEADEGPESQLFVFPPGAIERERDGDGEGPELGTVTVLQTGKGTMACPEGYCAWPRPFLPPLFPRCTS